MVVLAGGISLSALRWWGGLAVAQRSLAARCVSSSGSVTAGTIFDRTRTPLRMWFATAWLMTNQKQGVSALGVQRALGLGSYQIGVADAAPLSRGDVRPGRERLSGLVEVDEGYVGGVEDGLDGRQTDTKSIVAIAVEIEDPRVPDGSDCNASPTSQRTA
jgi:hypothetical protein